VIQVICKPSRLLAASRRVVHVGGSVEPVRDLETCHVRSFSGDEVACI
jgi:hypothetical protein